MQTTLPDQFETIQQQLEEYRESINENTFEVQSLFDYLREIDMKLERLSQRIDHLQLAREAPLSISLNDMEKNIFLALYTEAIPLSFREIAVKANVPLSMVPECISSLVEKGLTFVRSFYNNKLFIQLDPKWKELQAKENVINLSLQNFID